MIEKRNVAINLNKIIYHFIDKIMKNISLDKIEYKANESISNITTIKTKGIAKVFYPKTQKELIFLYNYFSINQIPFQILGNGSNVLINPKYKGFIISTKKIKKIIKINNEFVTVSNSVPLSILFKKTLENSLSGFENLALIPGVVGGAIKMNSSFKKQSISDNLIWIKVLQNGKIKKIKKNEINFRYRKSFDGLILSACFKLIKKDRKEIEKTFLESLNFRNTNQPKGNSFGSTFKNPKEYSSGYLIEKCSLKNHKIGDAVISQKHANFIINENKASFNDVYNLIKICKKEVKKKFNLNLSCEVVIIK